MSQVMCCWCQDVAFPEAYEGLELADLHRVRGWVGWVQCGMVPQRICLVLSVGTQKVNYDFSYLNICI